MWLLRKLSIFVLTLLKAVVVLAVSMSVLAIAWVALGDLTGWFEPHK
jgi:hypothetical protein